MFYSKKYIMSEYSKINPTMILLTGNLGKVSEFENMLQVSNWNLKHEKYDLIEIQSLSLKEVGFEKTKFAFSFFPNSSEQWILTDDTGLFFEGWNGLPGPLIKWFVEKIQLTDIFKQLQSTQKTLRAVASCVLSIGNVKTKEILQFEGSINGTIVNPRGKKGFGWDALFQPEGQNKTYAEMDFDEKNEYSHRAKAIEKLREWMAQY